MRCRKTCFPVIALIVMIGAGLSALPAGAADANGNAAVPIVSHPAATQNPAKLNPASPSAQNPAVSNYELSQTTGWMVHVRRFFGFMFLLLLFYFVRRRPRG